MWWALFGLMCFLAFVSFFAYRRIDEKLARLESLRASIVALADEWDAMAKRQRDQAEWDARRDYADSAAVKDGRASGYEACARELRQLAEGAKQ